MTYPVKLWILPPFLPIKNYGKRRSILQNQLFCLMKGLVISTSGICSRRIIKELEGELWPHGREVLLLGDGAALCHQAFSMWGARLAPEGVRYQRASSVALLGEQAAKEGKTVSAGELAPVYLRLPQAERELKKRQAEQANG